MRFPIKDDCRECVWCNTDFKPHCEVEKISLHPGEDGKIKPPDNCHYSADWKGWKK